jgi:hypothetical protein
MTTREPGSHIQAAGPPGARVPHCRLFVRNGLAGFHAHTGSPEHSCIQSHGHSWAFWAVVAPGPKAGGLGLGPADSPVEGEGRFRHVA